jgi:peroxiredoxin
MGAAGSAGREGLQQFELSGKPAPDFELESLAGETIKLSGLAGKVVVLDFWASWCGPCVAELPHIQELWEKLEGKEVLFIGVNLDRSVEDAERMARQKGLTFPSVRDEGGSVANAYGVRGIPCLVIIDADGKVVGRKLGYDPAVTEMLETEILKLLASAEPEQGAPAGQRSP